MLISAIALNEHLIELRIAFLAVEDGAIFDEDAISHDAVLSFTISMN